MPVILASVNSITKMLSNGIARLVAPRGTLPTATLRAVVDDAWIDNAPPTNLFYASGWARKRFNEVVGAYVQDYYTRNGKLPGGNHRIGASQRMIYFAPITREVGGSAPKAVGA